jgi:hypothetical protein
VCFEVLGLTMFSSCVLRFEVWRCFHCVFWSFRSDDVFIVCFEVWGLTMFWLCVLRFEVCRCFHCVLFRFEVWPCFHCMFWGLQWWAVKNETLRQEMISIFPLWTFLSYVATFQQHLHMEYISLRWYDIPELVVHIRISLIEGCY